MLLTRKDQDGKVVAYVYYTPVDITGKPCKEGEYAFVTDAWVHESIRHKDTIRSFAKEGLRQCPQLKWAYWQRSKYNERIKMFDIRRF